MKRVSKTVFAVLLIACIVASIAMAAFAANTSGTKVTGYKINSNNTDNQYNTSLEIYKGLTLTYVVSLVNYGYSKDEIVSIKENGVYAILEDCDFYSNVSNTAAVAQVSSTDEEIEKGILRFEVRFNDITYSGSGNQLKFSLNYRVNNAVEISSETSGDTSSGNTGNLEPMPMSQTVAMAEAVESVPVSESISLSIPRTREYVPPVSSESTSSGTNIVEVDSSTPVLLISNYTYGGSNVTAGQTFKLRMTFFNASKDFDIENIKITLSSAENAFTPVSSSNTFYISGIAANSSVTKEIELLADATLTPKSYGIAVSYDYESVYDKKRNKITSDETITIPVTQLDRFELGDLDYSSDGYVGMESYLSLNYTNKGKGTVYNLSARVEGEGFELMDAMDAMENLEAGKSETFEVSIVPTQGGTINGAVVIEYEDANGNKLEKRQEFTINVMESTPTIDPMPMPGGDDILDPMNPGTQEGGLGIWLWVIIGAGVLVAAVVAVVVVKKVKAKKLEDEDDEDI